MAKKKDLTPLDEDDALDEPSEKSDGYHVHISLSNYEGREIQRLCECKRMKASKFFSILFSEARGHKLPITQETAK
jgi:hypothetical protein